MSSGDKRDLLARALHYYAVNALDMADAVEKLGVNGGLLRVEARNASEISKQLPTLIKEQP